MRAPKLATEIANECRKLVNPKMVRRVLLKEKFHGYVICKKTFINECN